MSDQYFTSEEIQQLVATPKNIKASLEKHGHVVFVLCLDEERERERLQAACVPTERIRFIPVPEAHRCSVCGDLASYGYFRRHGEPRNENRCREHRKQ